MRRWNCAGGGVSSVRAGGGRRRRWSRSGSLYAGAGGQGGARSPCRRGGTPGLTCRCRGVCVLAGDAIGGWLVTIKVAVRTDSALSELGVEGGGGRRRAEEGCVMLRRRLRRCKACTRANRRPRRPPSTPAALMMAPRTRLVGNDASTRPSLVARPDTHPATATSSLRSGGRLSISTVQARILTVHKRRRCGARGSLCPCPWWVWLWSV